jgi:long-chain acyl-CoA synthetase
MTFDLSRYTALLPTLIIDLVAAELQAMRPQKFASLDYAALRGSEHWARDFALDSLERVTLSSVAAEFFNIYASGREDTLLGVANVQRWTEIISLSQSESARDITFRSSGTTGKPKHFRHRATWLEQEAAHWAAAASACAVTRVVSFVPTHHIYGYLWTILLPVFAHVDVRFVRGIELARPEVEPGDLLIATPRLLEQWAARSVPLNGAIAVSSTGRLERMTASQICADTGLADLWEIYGSSETAGLGCRKSGQTSYTWVPYVKAVETLVAEAVIAAPAGNIDSPHNNEVQKIERLTPEHTTVIIALPDAVYAGSNITQFSVGQRHDNIVKVFGQRVDLDALCERLRNIDGVADAAVRVFTDGNTAALKAFIVPEASVASAAALIDRCKAQIADDATIAAMISSWQTGAAIPVNSMGKRVDW